MTGACREFGWSVEHVLHEVPLAELHCLMSCASWSAGMEPAGETYEDREFDRTLERIKTSPATADHRPTGSPR